ncbi:hypothetical protein K7432_012239 [Basidiobolus ranarum]|uniref:Uncharacterized protein n=1 Tax=Basidiobolus ranarum TaxID=34480 RepID=A0ABR2WL27_9FUNG
MNLCEAVGPNNSATSSPSLPKTAHINSLYLIIISLLLVILLITLICGRHLWNRQKNARELRRRVKLTLRNITDRDLPWSVREKLPIYSINSSQITLPAPVVEKITSQMNELESAINSSENVLWIASPPPCYSHSLNRG